MQVGSAGYEAVIQQSARAAGIQAPLELSWAAVHEADWEAHVKASYKPLELAEGLWIVPEWCAALLLMHYTWRQLVHVAGHVLVASRAVAARIPTACDQMKGVDT